MLAVVPFLIFWLVGLCLGKPPRPLSETAGVPSRSASKIEGTSTITLRDGRQLEYIAIGPENGTPALFFHGDKCLRLSMPRSFLTGCMFFPADSYRFGMSFSGWGASSPCFSGSYMEAVIAAHQLRVYAVSLPGWGLSDAKPEYRGWGCWRSSRSTGRPLSDFVADIEEFSAQVVEPAHPVDHTGGGGGGGGGEEGGQSETPGAETATGAKFWVCGFSMGAMYAAAVAAGLPGRVRGVGIFGPTDPHGGGPYDGGCCGASFEPGGCTAFCSDYNSNMLTHPARDRLHRPAVRGAAVRSGRWAVLTVNAAVPAATLPSCPVEVSPRWDRPAAAARPRPPGLAARGWVGA